VTVPLRVLDLTPELWPALEALFGSNGACGGCWCMSWRVEEGERWDDLKGPRAKRRMKALVLAGEAHGVLAFDGDEPVGWCAYGPRRDFARLDRAPSLACDDADDVWSLPCFFVRRGWRGEGVATALLGGALRELVSAPPARRARSPRSRATLSRARAGARPRTRTTVRAHPARGRARP